MGIKYKDAGVDTQRGQDQVKLIKDLCKSTFDDNVLSNIGGFAGLYQVDQDYKNPVLVTGTDGVGTKLMISQALEIHDTVGQDLVAMCANDIICQGAKPMFFLDYIATGYLDPEKMALLVSGIVEGCKQAGAALIGGETAEMPGLYDKDEYDIAGFIVGIVEKDKLITGENIKEGDILVGLESSGIHSNGLSLARKIAFDHMGFAYEENMPELDKSIGEELLTPTRIYVKDILSLLDKVHVKGISNITGGGFYENVPRMLGENLEVKIDFSQVEIPEVFKLLQDWGEVEDKEMYSTFNMGIGMVLVVGEEDLDETLNHFNNYKAYVLGKVESGKGGIEIEY